jgi:hypothetical protein
MADYPLTLSDEQFKAIYASVCLRLKDLLNWRSEDVARVTVEETLAILKEQVDQALIDSREDGYDDARS